LAQGKDTIQYLPLLSDLPEGYRSSVPDEVRALDPLMKEESLPWFKYPKAVRRFGELVREVQPDLVHAGPIQLCAAVAAMAGSHPLVSMSWGSDLLWETRKPHKALLARYALSRTDAFVGDCKAVADKAVDYGMARQGIMIFPWGIDLEHFTPGHEETISRKLGWEGAFVLLSTRSLEPFYGVDLIVQAFLQLAPQVPSLRLMLLGKGSQKAHFQRLLSDAGLDARAHFAGMQTRADLPKFYRSADLYLSATKSDGSSVSLLEAMGCGLPSLVSDIPGNREWIVPGKTGWLFRSREPGSLAAGIKSILNDRGKLEAVGLAARRVVEKRANWHANFPKLLEAYQLARARSNRGVR
jgi:glycosyltransferase involved in cell wall biosynthesis